jgi:cell division protein FtsZ
MTQAMQGISEMQKYVDALIVIPNEKVKEMASGKFTMKDAFAAVDSVLYKAVRGISDLVTGVGFMNVDFADVTMALKDSGIAHMAMGKGKGDNKIQDALNEVLHSPLLETSIAGANRVLMNVSIPTSCTLDDFDTISAEITKNAAPNARVKAGIMFDDALEDDEISIIAIATDFGKCAASAVPSKVNIDDTEIISQISSNFGGDDPVAINDSDTSDIDALLQIRLAFLGSLDFCISHT